MKKLFIIMAICLLTFSCATQRYGRLQRLTPLESKYLSCEATDIEIEKCKMFIKDTNSHFAQFTGRDVLAAVGDLGIGNNMEYIDAIKSAEEREVELIKLRSEKGCKNEISEAAKTTAPKITNLGDAQIVIGEKKPAIFTHQDHQNKFSCNECHDNELKNKIVKDEDSGHKFCVTCHRKSNASIKCSSCHTR